MYITLQSVRRNLGLFQLEVKDLFIGAIFILLFTILFLCKFYTISLVVLAIGMISFIPVDFSKCKRAYQLFLLFMTFLKKGKNYYFYKG